MKIAVCALSHLTYVADFVGAAEVLAQRHQVCTFLGCPAASKPAQELLDSRRLVWETVCDRPLELTPPGPGRSAWKIFTGFFLAHARQVLPALLESLRRWRPDRIAAHLRDYAGFRAAQILGVPLVSFGSHTCPSRDREQDPPFGAGVEGNRLGNLAWKLQDAFHQRLEPHSQGLGLPLAISTCMSNRSVLLSLTPALRNQGSLEPEHVHYVGRLWTGGRADPEERDQLAFIAGLPRPRILLTLGSTYGPQLLPSCQAALSGSIVSAGPGAFFFRDLDAVLALVDAVVTVGAGKAVMDALAHGKPMVCLPQQGEQKEIALILRRLGAAELATLNRLPEVLAQVLREPRYQLAAQALQSEVGRCGGASEAASRVERMA